MFSILPSKSLEMSQSSATGSIRSATFTHLPTQAGNGSLPLPPVHCRNTACTSSRPSGEPMVTNSGTWNCACVQAPQHVVGDHGSLAVADDDERSAASRQALRQAVLHCLAPLLDKEEIVDVAQEGLRESLGRSSGAGNRATAGPSRARPALKSLAVGMLLPACIRSAMRIRKACCAGLLVSRAISRFGMTPLSTPSCASEQAGPLLDRRGDEIAARARLHREGLDSACG